MSGGWWETDRDWSLLAPVANRLMGRVDRYCNLFIGVLSVLRS